MWITMLTIIRQIQIKKEGTLAIMSLNAHFCTVKFTSNNANTIIYIKTWIKNVAFTYAACFSFWIKNFISLKSVLYPYSICSPNSLYSFSEGLSSSSFNAFFFYLMETRAGEAFSRIYSCMISALNFVIWPSL